MAILGKDEVWKFVWTPYKRYQCVVAYQILAAFDLQNLTASPAANGREAQDQISPGTSLQQLRPGELRDISCDSQRPVRPPAVLIHQSLRETPTILTCDVLNKLTIRLQQWTTGISSQHIRLVGEGIAACGAQSAAGSLRQAVNRLIHAVSPAWIVNQQ
jgi:hypothetical protein